MTSIDGSVNSWQGGWGVSPYFERPPQGGYFHHINKEEMKNIKIQVKCSLFF